MKSKKKPTLKEQVRDLRSRLRHTERARDAFFAALGVARAKEIDLTPRVDELEIQLKEAVKDRTELSKKWIAADAEVTRLREFLLNEAARARAYNGPASRMATLFEAAANGGAS